MRDKIIQIIKQAEEEFTGLIMHGKFDNPDDIPSREAMIADKLIENGMLLPRNKPIGVMTDGNKFNSDVYCPYCGTNLSGLYGDEPTPIVQCYNCGEFLDNTKVITKEEAEQALKGGEG